MNVRPARPGDAAAAADVLRRSIAELCRDDHGDDPEVIAAWIANKTAHNVEAWIAAHHVVVAETAGHIVGVALVTATGEVRLNYVAPAARMTGVSKAMIAHIETWARERGVAALALTSTETARRFYLALGFEAAGSPVAGPGDAQAYPMRKRL